MQLSRRQRAPGAKPIGFFGVGAGIVAKEGPLALYKGLGAVVTGIVPKMAIRFSSFEFYKSLAPINPDTGRIAAGAVFLCKLFLYDQLCARWR
jgi:solute carrier family 25 citrate transporter 1